MKSGRQAIILELIEKKDIETQNQLLEELWRCGIKTTQATLSRDIRDLKLIKEQTENGTYRYSTGSRAVEENVHEKLRNILKECFVSYDLAQNLLVIKTLPGLANAACSALDGMEIENLVGTIAGDDTAFIAMRDNQSAINFYNEISSII